MLVNGAHNVQLLSRVPECGCGSKIPLLGENRASGSLGKAIEQLLRGTEMANNAHPRSSALVSIGFYDAPVSFSADDIVLKAWHESYIHNLVLAVNGNRKCRAVVSLSRIAARQNA